MSKAITKAKPKKLTLKDEIADLKADQASLVNALTKARDALDKYVRILLNSSEPSIALEMRENEQRLSLYLKQFGVERWQDNDKQAKQWNEHSKALVRLLESKFNGPNQADKAQMDSIIEHENSKIITSH